MTEPDTPIKLRLASHVIDFACSQCGECCTNKWTIDVDTESYNKLYKKFEEVGRHKEFDEHILHDKARKQVRFLANGKCPYLSASNLCSVQLTFGEKYLLDICKTYPRSIFLSSHGLEFSLCLTCKAAVKTLQNYPIRLLDTSWPIKKSETIPFYFIEPNNFRHYDPDKLLLADSQLPYHALEMKLIKLFQDNSVSVRERLITVGTILIKGINKEFDTMFSSNQPLAVPPNLTRHLSHFFLLANIFIRKYSSLHSAKLLRKLLMTVSSDTHDDVIESAIDFNYAKVQPPSTDTYQNMLTSYYKPALKTIEPILENYMVNYILSKHFYLRPLHFAYYRMTFSFAAITLLSIGYSLVQKQPISQPIVLQAIYDVESIFYDNWFYPYLSFMQADQTPLEIVENAIALANI